MRVHEIIKDEPTNRNQPVNQPIKPANQATSDAISPGTRVLPKWLMEENTARYPA